MVFIASSAVSYRPFFVLIALDPSNPQQVYRAGVSPEAFPRDCDLSTRGGAREAPRRHGEGEGGTAKTGRGGEGKASVSVLSFVLSSCSLLPEAFCRVLIAAVLSVRCLVRRPRTIRGLQTHIPPRVLVAIVFAARCCLVRRPSIIRGLPTPPPAECVWRMPSYFYCFFSFFIFVFCFLEVDDARYNDYKYPSVRSIWRAYNTSCFLPLALNPPPPPKHFNGRYSSLLRMACMDMGACCER